MAQVGRAAPLVLAAVALVLASAGSAQSGLACQTAVIGGTDPADAGIGVRCTGRPVRTLELTFSRLARFDATASVVDRSNAPVGSVAVRRMGTTLALAFEPPLAAPYGVIQQVDRQAAASYQVRATADDGSTVSVTRGAPVGPAPGGGATGGNCARSAVGTTPLTDLGAGTYQGRKGGLYPGGRNTPSAAYLQQGLAEAGRVRPRGLDGSPSSGGRVVLLSIGMSNATQEFSAFKALADADARKSPALTIVDGAQGGQTASAIANPAAAFWTEVDRRLAVAGVTAAQVQAAWLKEANAGPTEPFPADALRLKEDLRRIVANLRARYPNLRLVYLSSRTYAGYAVTTLNPEPYAYQSGFAVKWTIGDRIDGKLDGPWLGWGPYLWTDGLKGRKDGLVWACEDAAADGTHPSQSGRAKVADLLLRHFTTDPTARGWFRR